MKYVLLRQKMVRKFCRKFAEVSRNLDGPIRANRFADSRESPDSRESFQGSRTEPLFANHAPRGRGPKIANRRFEAIRAILIKMGVFCESIRVNRFARIAPIRVANRRAI